MQKRLKDTLTGRFLSKNQKDLEGLVQIGQMFGHWCVVSSEIKMVKGHRYVKCCDGYAEMWVAYDNLASGKSTHSKRFPRSGHAAYGKIRGRWEQIKERCENPQSRTYQWYGARGITLSEEFHNPRVFADYVLSLEGYGPRKHLDRIDNDKGYERGNLRWVTCAQNQRNKRGVVYVEYRGEKMVFMDFVKRHTYLSYGWARDAFHRGVPLEELAKMPPGTKSVRRIERENNVTFSSYNFDRT